MTDRREHYWRLILGGDGYGADLELSAMEQQLDQALQALYGGERRGGLGGSSPKVATWLGDIRRLFPSTVVRVMQRDAMERLGLQQLLLEPEILETIQPDVHLAATLISLKEMVPAKARATAREVVRRVVEALLQRLQEPLREAVTGSLDRARRNRRPRFKEIDWERTIRANLQHYSPEHRTIVPERLIGFGRKRAALQDIVLCVDQSGSMAPSVVHAGISAAVLASLPAVATHLVCFDTTVVDLTEQLHDDPVELLFGVQLGGGTDIAAALGYCRSLVTRPQQTVMVLISDLYDGGHSRETLRHAAELIAAGVNLIVLLALADDGAPSYDHQMATDFATLGAPTFACTPDQFPELMAAALAREDIANWAAERGIGTTRGA